MAARSEGHTLTLASHEVAVVDTTGAGDTFAGVFAAARCEGLDLRKALSRALAAAAVACTRPRAQQAQPSRQEIETQRAVYGAR